MQWVWILFGLFGGWIGFVILRTLYRWTRWIIRRKLYYSDIPLVEGTWYPRFKPDDFDFRTKATITQFAGDQGRLPVCIDSGYFGKGRASISLIKPEDIKFILRDPVRFPKTPETKEILAPMLGNGLVTSEGSVWKRQRKLLSHVFHNDTLRRMVPAMEQQIIASLFSNESRFEGGEDGEKSNKIHSSLSQLIGTDYVNPVPFWERLTLRIILAACFGTHFDLDDLARRWNGVGHAFLPYVIGRVIIGPLFDYLPISASRNMMSGMESIKNEIAKMVATRRAQENSSSSSSSSTPSSSPSSPPPPSSPPLDPNESSDAVVDLLTMMIQRSNETGQRISDEELIYQSLTIMFAGHETTSSTLSWCSYFLGLHPQVQERCYAEIEQFRAEHPGEPSNEPGQTHGKIRWTPELIRTCFPLTTAVFNETLRLRPPAPTLGRLIQEDTVLPSGFTVKAGDRVNGSITLCCVDGEFWGPDATEWVPDRWLLPSFKQSSPFFPVFSAFDRNCLGERFARLEGVLALIFTLENYRLELDPQSRSQVKMKIVVTVQPSGLKVRFIPRN